MYIGYLDDRKKLGFSCIKDVRAAKQISDLKNFIKRTRGVSVAYIVKKGKQICILIFSKEVLVAVLIFVQSISVNIDSDVYCPSSSSSKAYQCRIVESTNLEFKESLKSFKYPSPISDYILKLKGGSDKLTDEEQEKLLQSILARTPESDIDEMNINKLLQRLKEIIYPVISDQRLWRIISE
jgi:hypothetical protein